MPVGVTASRMFVTVMAASAVPMVCWPRLVPVLVPPGNTQVVEVYFAASVPLSSMV